MMLKSHSNQEQTFDYYASFLRNILEGQDKYKALIQPVIVDTKSLVEKQKDYYSINRNGFEVIVFLAKKAPDFFNGLNTEHVSNEDYAHILQLITSSGDLIPA
jgi:hypothetical protein